MHSDRDMQTQPALDILVVAVVGRLGNSSCWGNPQAAIVDKQQQLNTKEVAPVGEYSEDT